MEIERLDPERNMMQNMKQRFFAMRNGVVADMLRNAGSPYRIIFGLNLPQLKEIAEAFAKDNIFADELWNNISTRESRLIAPMIADASSFTKAEAKKWLGNLTSSAEEVDILCHRLLRHTGFALELRDELKDSEDPWLRYAALRLSFDEVMSDPQKIKELAEKELSRDCAITRAAARQLIAEATLNY